MQQPRRLFVLGTGAAGAENGGGCSREFRLHEEIAESGMRRVRGRSREHHFRITGQFNDARRGGTIGDRDAPQLHVVFRRHADLGVDFETGMTLPKLRARLREDGFVAFRRAQGGLIRGGPELSRRQIAQINKRPPAIARGIFAPAGDRQIAPAAVAAAGAADDDMIATVGQQMNLRHRRRGIRENAHRRFRLRQRASAMSPAPDRR